MLIMFCLQIVVQRHHATVSIVHAFTKNPEHITCEADIVVTAAGVPNLVRGNWLKPGAVVIDVGTNPVEVNSLHSFWIIIYKRVLILLISVEILVANVMFCSKEMEFNLLREMNNNVL